MSNLPAQASSVKSMLQKAMVNVAAALPHHMTPERIISVVMTAVHQTPRLKECDSLSLTAAVVQASLLGLELGGVRGQAHLVPYKGKAQLIPGYRGLADLARRSGEIKAPRAHAVRENDLFVHELGTENKLVHQPTLNDRGEIIAFYAVVDLVGGGHQFEVMTKSQVETIRDNSPGYKIAKQYNKSSVWDDHFEEMGRKTVFRRLAKWLPMSVELATAINLDNQAYQGVPQQFELPDGMLDVTPETNEQGSQDPGPPSGLAGRMAAKEREIMGDPSLGVAPETAGPEADEPPPPGDHDAPPPENKSQPLDFNQEAEEPPAPSEPAKITTSQASTIKGQLRTARIDEAAYLARMGHKALLDIPADEVERAVDTLDAMKAEATPDGRADQLFDQE